MNVLGNPFDSCTLILDGEVVESIEAPRVGIGEYVHSVINGDHNVLLGTVNPIGRDLCRNVDAASVITASGREDHDRKLRVSGSIRRSPYCKRQTVLGRVLSDLPSSKTFSVVYDEIAGDVEGPCGWYGGHIL
jgi:hypothetical protein